MVNLNSTTSILHNGMFEICSSVAFGDCGYLSILNTIQSDPEISKEIIRIILQKLKNTYNKNITKRVLDLDMLRNIIAEERYYQELVKMLPKT